MKYPDNWKDEKEIEKKIPFGFENFPPDLKNLYRWHIQCSLNSDELSHDLNELRKLVFEKERLYYSSMEKVKETSEEIKEFFKGKKNEKD